ncbi:MAG: right-handed parallel beta-helix repeat-containing protein, partial [Planctomycetota bacterium]
NNAAESGGGMYNDSWDEPAAGNRVILTDCTFSGNSSLVAGGGIYNFYCDSILTTCTFEDNSTIPGTTGGGGICNDRSLTTLTNCTFSGNSTSNGAGGGLFNRENSDANVVDCVFTGNSAYYHGGGMYNRGKAMVVNCTFSGNSGHLYSHSSGGGIADYYGDWLTLVNCVFSGNSAGFGGGMFNRRSDYVNVVNCTFSSNSATYSAEGGGIYNRDCDPIITNCIIWGNIGEQIYNYYSTADPNITYSCIQGGYPGTGNISSNPMFSSFDLRIESPSPCIDAGNNDALPPDTLDLDDDSDTTELIPWDRASKLRRADDPAVDPDPGNAGTIGPPIVDMGAYEVSPIFVDDNASSWGDGRSWTTAYKYLQDALFTAADPLGGRGEIRVAQGTYYPDQSEWGYVAPADREATFEMHNNLAIRGGYRGPAGGGNPDDRDITVFETILSGDYANDDDPNDPNSYDENSYHVVHSRDTDATAIIKGFTITGGNANGPRLSEETSGAGLYNVGGSPFVSKCTFVRNKADGNGGGMCNTDGEPTVSNCVFRANTAEYGGAVQSDSYGRDLLKLVGCVLSENSATSGGGFYVSGGAILTDCVFHRNTVSHSGGGLTDFSTSELVLANCIFRENTAKNGGGMYSYDGRAKLSNCTFSGNTAVADGGGISIDSSIPSLVNCVFNGNTANRGGAFRNFHSPMTAVNCTISKNHADDSGGGIYDIYIDPYYAKTLTNCILWSNSDSNGVGEWSQIRNESFVGEVITYCCIQGGTTYCSDPNNHNIGADPNDNPQFVRDPNNGGDGWADDPNTPEDESANDDYGDLRLRAGSPCIDVGNNDADIYLLTPEIDPIPGTDLDGRPRFADGDCNDTNNIDMGAYEFTSTYFGDFDVDCDVDFTDYSIFAGYWLTDELLVDIAPTPAGDGIIDKKDLNILCNNWLLGK